MTQHQSDPPQPSSFCFLLQTNTTETLPLCSRVTQLASPYRCAKPSSSSSQLVPTSSIQRGQQHTPRAKPRAGPAAGDVLRAGKSLICSSEQHSSLPQETLPGPALRSQPHVHFPAAADHSHAQRSLKGRKQKLYIRIKDANFPRCGSFSGQTTRAAQQRSRLQGAPGGEQTTRSSQRRAHTALLPSIQQQLAQCCERTRLQQHRLNLTLFLTWRF